MQINGVPPRIAQELMRHSDRRLTDQVYLDSSLLPLQESMRSIDGYQKWTQLWTHFSGEDRQILTRIVERWGRLSDELKEAILAITHIFRPF